MLDQAKSKHVHTHTVLGLIHLLHMQDISDFVYGCVQGGESLKISNYGVHTAYL